MSAVRSITVDDLGAARALFESEHSTAPFLERAGELLAAVERREAYALVAAEGSALRGVLVCGAVAGSSGTAAITAFCVAPAARQQGIGTALLTTAVSSFAAAGARLIVTEVAADPRLEAAHALLRSAGFVEEGRLRDFVAPGTDLLILVVRLAG